MQDWKNNSRNKNLASGSGPQPDGQHPFDRALRGRLADAEVTPSQDLMDKMFAQLGETSTQENGVPVNKNNKQQGTTPVKRLRWRKMGITYAAAIAGILVVLAIGIKELNNKNTVVLPPANLTALNKTDPGTHTGTDQRAPIAVPAQQTARAAATAPKRRDHQQKKQVDRTVKGSGNAGPEVHRAHPADRNKVSGQNAATKMMAHAAVQSADLPAIKTASVSPVIPEGQMEQKVPLQEKVNLEDHAASPTHSDIAVIPKQGKGVAITHAGIEKQNVISALNPDQPEKRKENQTVRTAIDNNRRTGREKGGLLRGIFKKIGDGARAITEEVVSQQEDRTVINVGVVAITAYK